jgi:choline dehydrogenase-like flavoprotein
MGFDLIVIGSGFGGAITSCRLAEKGKTALVLERSTKWDRRLKRPGYFFRASGPPCFQVNHATRRFASSFAALHSELPRRCP